MNGIRTDASASLRATLVWVNAAGLMTMKSTPEWRDFCIRSMSSDSELLWKLSN